MIQPKVILELDSTHMFHLKERDRGFAQLTENRRANVVNPKSGFLKDGALTFKCAITVLDESTLDQNNDDDVTVGWNYDSKKETGFVGLENQGATCYLNSLVQSLYHIPMLRSEIYNIDTNSDNVESPKVPLALQKLFFRLQTDDKAVETKELTRSFGWTSQDAFVQHDIQELLRLLTENLENRVKGTESAHLFTSLLRGKVYNYLKFIDVNDQTTKIEDFYGTLLPMNDECQISMKRLPHFVRACRFILNLSLNVKGCKSLEKSLELFCEAELLDDKIKTDNHGPQRALKGILFDSLPPILHLHLKRFEIDMYSDDLRYTKVNDRFSFPPILKMAPFMAPTATDDDKADAVYHLHGVLVHRGSLTHGHYYAFLRPQLADEWLKFDDDVVTKCKERAAIEANFGGVKVSNLGAMPRSASAYMLVYIREKDRQRLFKTHKTEDIPRPLFQRFQDLLAVEEATRQGQLTTILCSIIELGLFAARREARSTKVLYIITSDDIAKHHGADLVNPFTCQSFRVRATDTISTITDTLSAHYKIPVQRIVLWEWTRRENKTHRPDKELIEEHEYDEINYTSKIGSNHVLWMEELPPDTPRVKRASDEYILLFFKHYDPETESLRVVGRGWFDNTMLTNALVAYGRRLLDMDSDAPLIAYEEVRHTRPKMSMNYPTFIPDIHVLPMNTTLDDSELLVGDIIILQKELEYPKCTTFSFPTAIDYYKYLQRQRNITFKPHPGSKLTKTIELQLSLTDNVPTIIKKLANVLLVSSHFIRLTRSRFHSENPADEPVSVDPQLTLESLIDTIYDEARVIYYEVLKVSLKDLLSYIEVCVRFRRPNFESTSPKKFFMPLEASVQDAAKQLAIEASLPPLNEVRLIGIKQFVIRKGAQTFQEPYLWYIEEIPPEELNCPEGSVRIQCVTYTLYNTHLRKSVVEFFGDPFFIFIAKDEPMSAIRNRIQQRLNVSLKSTKFSIITLSEIDKYLELDEPVPISTFEEKRFMLGIERKDAFQAGVNAAMKIQ